MKLRSLLITLALAIVCGLAACVSGGGTTPPGDPVVYTTEQKVAFACTSASAGMKAVNAARRAQKVSLADHATALAAFHLTDPFCQPPVTSINDVDWSSLLSAAATITAVQAGARP